MLALTARQPWMISEKRHGLSCPERHAALSGIAHNMTRTTVWKRRDTSARDRLLNLARQQKEDFQLILSRRVVLSRLIGRRKCRRRLSFQPGINQSCQKVGKGYDILANAGLFQCCHIFVTPFQRDNRPGIATTGQHHVH